MTEEKSRSGFVALVGRPNCGKSTLMNTVLGEDLAIVTSLPQTTRQNLKGIYTSDSVQIVFVDTPGIHQGSYSFNKSMVMESAQLLKRRGADIICYLVDLSRPFGAEEDFVAQSVAGSGIPVVIIFNKKDLCPEPAQTIAAFSKRYPALQSTTTIIVSALKKETKEQFLSVLVPMLDEGPRFFPEDDLTDADMRFFAAEYIRKQIILNTADEVPHAAFVEILQYQESKTLHRVEAEIHVETDGQKAIIIGSKGALIKKIQKESAFELQKLTGTPVSMVCHVKISPKWRNDERFLRDKGFFVN
jgi:GTP-binding protein Era